MIRHLRASGRQDFRISSGGLGHLKWQACIAQLDSRERPLEHCTQLRDSNLRLLQDKLMRETQGVVALPTRPALPLGIQAGA